ncbi:MAG: tRNA preQ1(34) S-adenosylmethionine ribosyltransferase-isomerase QueA, partial [Gammaproteobacteria bacterium]|nr:tRNA preQ1(34) S-adenosylmethionine ribosyltransferase-isomerase QueA [Gammaproteobacteria bacterium]
MRRTDFRFDLPQSLIAQRPLDARSASRLLVLAGDSMRHCRFDDLPDLLGADDLLIVNDSRVVKARLMAQKDSGGRAEVLVERILDTSRALCQVRVSKPLKPNRCLYLDGHRIDVVDRADEFYLLDFNAPVAEYLDAHGDVPLPPYIERSPDAKDEDRYQTVYAAVPGAVAAPTAGLHFDDDVLDRLRAKGVGIASVTLHVGAGTFQPVREDDLSRHRMHAERYAIPDGTRRAIDECEGRVVAVGTTVVRTLESAAATGDDCGETRLFITPGYRFRVVDA